MFTKTLVDEFLGMTRVVQRPRSPPLFEKTPKLAFSKGYGEMLYNLVFGHPTFDKRLIKIAKLCDDTIIACQEGPRSRNLDHRKIQAH